jgi:hypothetical protein
MSDELVQKIVEIIRTHVNPKRSLTNLNQNLAPAITEIIKRGVPEAPKVVTHAPTNDVARAITKIIQNKVRLSPNVVASTVEKLTTEGNQTDEIIQKILKAIKNALPPPVVAPPTETRPANAIGEAYWAGTRHGWVFGSPNAPRFRLKGKTDLLDEHKGWKLRRRNDTNKYNFYYTRPPRPVSQPWTWPSFFRPKNKMPVFGPNLQPNFLEPQQTGVNNQGRPTYNQVPPMPGYVLTTRNGKTGWYRNKGPAAPPPVTSGPTAPPGPSRPRNYSKMSIRELLDAMKKYPENRSTIVEALRKAVEKELRDLRYEYSRARRTRKLGDLLRLLPRNYNGRRNASSMVVNDVRETRNSRELSNLRSNLGSVPNENIRRALENQRRRFENKKRQEENERRRTRRVGENINYGRRLEVVRRVNESNNEYELRRRRAALENVGRGGNGGAGAGYGGNGGAGGNGAGGVSRPFNQAPVLPENQRQAINNAGGVNRAMNTVIHVPGGPREIAKAAEALNETGGNVAQVIQIKGASPEAVKAVQNLGGPKNAVNVLEGLNTLSRKTHRKRGTPRPRRKTYRPRIAELNRVLNSVKKQRLISLMAHNVTKTHNIHPNDEKLKTYYKKVLKANILRTPFAKVVKRAAKKTL